jgi:putative Mg2+ transporter-C (MgtC) family protein
VEAVVTELSDGLPTAEQFMRVLIRMTAAALLGAVVGFERERSGKPAGLRTHMLVSLGTALFVIACLESGMSSEGMSRVVQGLATGIGFLGAGAILKLTEQKDIKGLTTAAGIWMTAALGVAAGLGRWGSAAVGVVMIWIILSVLDRVDERIEARRAVEKIEDTTQ